MQEVRGGIETEKERKRENETDRMDEGVRAGD